MTTNFPMWLQRKIDEQGWSVTEASRRIGVNHTVVSAWLRGTRRPKDKSLQKVAKALRIDTVVVMEAAGHIPPGDTPDPNSNYAQVLGMVNAIDWETYPDRLDTVKAILDLYVKADERERAEDDALERDAADENRLVNTTTGDGTVAG